MFNGRVLVITGAGISAESGIPTFRGKEGYWRNLNPADLATPEAFARDPNLVWEWYRERRAKIRAAQPNAAHGAIARLAGNCRDFLLVTQNVDDLHTRAEWDGCRVSTEQIVQIHGDIFLTHCSRCDSNELNQREADGRLPACARCHSLMRPGVVWFGEQLDLRNIDRVEKFFAAGGCDLVLVIGTTATFGYIIDWAVRAANANGRIIEINPAETSLSPFARELIRQPAAVALPNVVDALLKRDASIH